MGSKCSTLPQTSNANFLTKPCFALVIFRQKPTNRLKIHLADKHVLHIVQKSVADLCEPGSFQCGRDLQDSNAFEIRFTPSTSNIDHQSRQSAVISEINRKISIGSSSCTKVDDQENRDDHEIEKFLIRRGKSVESDDASSSADGCNFVTNLKFKKILCKILKDLSANGWTLVYSSDRGVSYITDELTTWFFRKTNPPQYRQQQSYKGTGLKHNNSYHRTFSQDPELYSSSPNDYQKSNNNAHYQPSSYHHSKYDFVCLSINGPNILQLINCDSARLIRLFRKSAISIYTFGLSDERYYSDKDYEVHFVGCPFNANEFDENLAVKRLILELFKRFEDCGYKYYSTANLTGTTSDCIFFYREEGYVEQHYEKRKISAEHHHKSHNGRPITDHNKNNVSNLSSENNDAAKSSMVMVTFNKGDRLCLIDCSTKMVQETRNAIKKYWKYGWQTESNFHTAWEFKLAGNPWSFHTNDNIVGHVRYFVTKLFHHWASETNSQILACVDVGYNMNKDIAFILKCRNSNFAVLNDDSTTAHMCLVMNEIDRIRLINGSQDVKSVIRHTIIDNWTFGLHKEAEKSFVTPAEKRKNLVAVSQSSDPSFLINSEDPKNDRLHFYEFKMSHKPWIKIVGEQYDHETARKVMCNLLRMLNDKGWTVVCSGDICWHSAKNLDKNNGGRNGAANFFYNSDLYSCFLTSSVVVK
uniref:Uncharacterized protein n=1 Tax=Romanomermis culicivorax TaxID=13658 RepID=A0A915HRJ2_ROMCU